MAEQVNVSHGPSRTHVVEEETTPRSFPMTSTCMLRHILTHRHTYVKELFEKKTLRDRLRIRGEPGLHKNLPLKMSQVIEPRVPCLQLHTMALTGFQGLCAQDSPQLLFHSGEL